MPVVFFIQARYISSFSLTFNAVVSRPWWIKLKFLMILKCLILISIIYFSFHYTWTRPLQCSLVLAGGCHEGTFELWVDAMLCGLLVVHDVREVSHEPPTAHLRAASKQEKQKR